MSCRPWILPKASSRETSTWCSTPKCREEDISLAGNSRNFWWETCASFSGNCEAEHPSIRRHLCKFLENNQGDGERSADFEIAGAVSWPSLQGCGFFTRGSVWFQRGQTDARPKSGRPLQVSSPLDFERARSLPPRDNGPSLSPTSRKGGPPVAWDLTMVQYMLL